MFLTTGSLITITYTNTVFKLPKKSLDRAQTGTTLLDIVVPSANHMLFGSKKLRILGTNPRHNHLPKRNKI